MVQQRLFREQVLETVYRTCKTRSERRYNLFLAEDAKKKGIKIKMERFPWIVLNRMFEKTINGNIRNDHLKEICKNSPGLEERYFARVKAEILQNAEEFAERMQIDEEWDETKIFKVATKIATLIECRELEIKNAEGEVLNTITALSKDEKSDFLIKILSNTSFSLKYQC